MGDIWVGTCGYQYFDPGAGWQEQHESKLAVYSTRFPIVEVNRSFYRLPEIKTVQRWRRETVTGFEYSMKVWQAITHPWQSPTWNDNRDQIPESKTDTVGFFQPTETVYDAWEKTRARATALDAAVVVFQTPPSFDCSETHIANMREFFSEVRRDGLTLAWEPRGEWLDHPDRVRELCSELDLILVFDIMDKQPALEQDMLYTRLHGGGDDQHEYDYEYSDAELEKVCKRLVRRAETHEKVFCLFNNHQKFQNARSLLQRLPRGT